MLGTCGGLQCFKCGCYCKAVPNSQTWILHTCSTRQQQIFTICKLCVPLICVWILLILCFHSGPSESLNPPLHLTNCLCLTSVPPLLLFNCPAPTWRIVPPLTLLHYYKRYLSDICNRTLFSIRPFTALPLSILQMLPTPCFSLPSEKLSEGM